MPIPTDLYEKISHLVAENRVNSAIELLEKQLPALKQHNPEQYHAALVLMQDFNDIQERKINGLLVAEAETNSFSFRLLEFSRILGRKFTSPPPPPPAASPDPLRMAQPAYSVPKTGPVNAKPGSRSSENASGGGLTFGKLVLYGLAGLGVLVFIAVLMELGGETEDPEPTTPTTLQPTLESTPIPLSDLPVNFTNLQLLLGSSSWMTDDESETHLIFSEDGTTADEDIFLGRLDIRGFEGGHYYGTLSETDSQFPGMNAWVTLSDDRQILRIVPVDENAQPIEENEAYFYRL